MPTTYSTAKAPRASKAGIAVVADTSQIARLAKDLRRASPAAWKACRTSLRAAGQVVADDAKGRAAFSTRIPNSIRVRVTSGGNVKVIAGDATATDAAPIENKGKGHVRHPVFVPKAKLPGPPGSWTEKNSPPAYLGPALEAHREEAAKAIEDAVVHAVELAIGAK